MTDERKRKVYGWIMVVIGSALVFYALQGMYVQFRLLF